MAKLSDVSVEFSTERTGATKEKQATTVVKFNLKDIHSHFEDSFNRINQMSQINVEDLVLQDQISRSQIVFIVSAFDFFMHEISKLCLCQMFEGNIKKTEKYNSLELQLRDLHSLFKIENKSEWFLTFINNKFEHITLVSFDSVKNQCNLIGLDITKIANDVFYTQGDKTKTIVKLKSFMSELFMKRNSIAHQFDRSHKNAEVQNISNEYVSTAIEIIKKIEASIISQCASMKDC